MGGEFVEERVKSRSNVGDNNSGSLLPSKVSEFPILNMNNSFPT